MKPDGLYLIWSKMDDCQLDHYRSVLAFVQQAMRFVTNEHDMPDLIFSKHDEQKNTASLYGWWMFSGDDANLQYITRVDLIDCNDDVRDLLTLRREVESLAEIDVPVEWLWHDAVLCHMRGLIMNIALINGPGGGNPLVQIGGARDDVLFLLTDYANGDEEEALFYLDGEE